MDGTEPQPSLTHSAVSLLGVRGGGDNKGPISLLHPLALCVFPPPAAKI